jgi:hypothetical protein
VRVIDSINRNKINQNFPCHRPLRYFNVNIYDHFPTDRYFKLSVKCEAIKPNNTPLLGIYQDIYIDNINTNIERPTPQPKLQSYS